MEANEAAEHIEHQARAEHAVRTPVAIYIAVLAVLLALVHLGGSNAMKEMLPNSIRASDSFNYYQSKLLRQQQLSLAAQQLDLTLPGAPEAAQPAIREAVADLRRQADAALASEHGHGLQDLLATAQEQERSRDAAAARDPWFDRAEGLLQVAIVLASVFAVLGRRFILWLSWAAGAVGVALAAYAALLSG
jgi:hypothetical protein